MSIRGSTSIHASTTSMLSEGGFPRGGTRTEDRCQKKQLDLESENRRLKQASAVRTGGKAIGFPTKSPAKVFLAIRIPDKVPASQSDSECTVQGSPQDPDTQKWKGTFLGSLFETLVLLGIFFGFVFKTRFWNSHFITSWLMKTVFLRFSWIQFTGVSGVWQKD